MQRLLKKYIRLVFENEGNKTFKGILASLTPEENTPPIELNTDHTGYNFLINKAEQAEQAEQAGQAKKNKKA